MYIYVIQFKYTYICICTVLFYRRIPPHVSDILKKLRTVAISISCKRTRPMATAPSPRPDDYTVDPLQAVVYLSGRGF